MINLICRNCGNELIEDAVFCNKCGAKQTVAQAIQKSELSSFTQVSDINITDIMIPSISKKDRNKLGEISESLSKWEHEDVYFNELCKSKKQRLIVTILLPILYFLIVNLISLFIVFLISNPTPAQAAFAAGFFIVSGVVFLMMVITYVIGIPLYIISEIRWSASIHVSNDIINTFISEQSVAAYLENFFEVYEPFECFQIKQKHTIEFIFNRKKGLLIFNPNGEIRITGIYKYKEIVPFIMEALNCYYNSKTNTDIRIFSFDHKAKIASVLK